MVGFGKMPRTTPPEVSPNRSKLAARKQSPRRIPKGAYGFGFTAPPCRAI